MEPVYSRDAAENLCHAAFRQATARVMKHMGFVVATENALNTSSHLMRKYFEDLCQRIAMKQEVAGRNFTTFSDVDESLKDVGNSVSEIHDYLLQIGQVVMEESHQLPVIPVRRMANATTGHYSARPPKLINPVEEPDLRLLHRDEPNLPDEPSTSEVEQMEVDLVQNNENIETKEPVTKIKLFTLTLEKQVKIPDFTEFDADSLDLADQFFEKTEINPEEFDLGFKDPRSPPMSPVIKTSNITPFKLVSAKDIGFPLLGESADKSIPVAERHKEKSKKHKKDKEKKKEKKKDKNKEKHKSKRDLAVFDSKDNLPPMPGLDKYVTIPETVSERTATPLSQKDSVVIKPEPSAESQSAAPKLPLCGFKLKPAPQEYQNQPLESEPLPASSATANVPSTSISTPGLSVASREKSPEGAVSTVSEIPEHIGKETELTTTNETAVVQLNQTDGKTITEDKHESKHHKKEKKEKKDKKKKDKDKEGREYRKRDHHGQPKHLSDNVVDTSTVPSAGHVDTITDTTMTEPQTCLKIKLKFGPSLEAPPTPQPSSTVTDSKTETDEDEHKPKKAKLDSDVACVEERNPTPADDDAPPPLVQAVTPVEMAEEGSLKEEGLKSPKKHKKEKKHKREKDRDHEDRHEKHKRDKKHKDKKDKKRTHDAELVAPAPSLKIKIAKPISALAEQPPRDLTPNPPPALSPEKLAVDQLAQKDKEHKKHKKEKKHKKDKLEFSKPLSSKPATPKPSASNPATPAPLTPKPTTPKPLTPKPTTPKPLTPKSATPKPATPKPVTPSATEKPSPPKVPELSDTRAEPSQTASASRLFDTSKDTSRPSSTLKRSSKKKDDSRTSTPAKSSSRPSSNPLESGAPSKSGKPKSKSMAEPIKGKRGRRKRKEGEKDKVWVCPSCSVAYVDGAADMVGCDQCNEWFHWHCVGMLRPPASDEDWFCPSCSKERKSAKAKTKKK